MKEIQLSKIDLNLLVVLDVLLREKSVTRAADRLNITSSAVSHALKRLRTLFDNELLVRDGRRMVPTARGEELAKALPILLVQVTQTLATSEAFNPATSDRVFRLSAPDFISPLIPILLNILAKEAPHVRLELTAYSKTAVTELSQGQHDALIAPTLRQSHEVRSERIGAWHWQVYAHKNHPVFENWSLESWAQFPHLQVGMSSSPGRGPIDDKIAKFGMVRQIGAVIPQFSMAAPILANTDMLLSVPSMAMDAAAQVYELERRDLPFEFDPLELSLFRSATLGDSAEITWFHERVKLAAQNL